jgi:hypothetical protein
MEVPREAEMKAEKFCTIGTDPRIHALLREVELVVKVGGPSVLMVIILYSESPVLEG